jgi:hypothetical protein
MKFCKKDECHNIACYKSKYCEIHKPINRVVHETKYTEDRNIIEQQNLEYEESLFVDKEMLELQREEEMFKKILIKSKETDVEEKKKKITEEPDSNYIYIKFKLSTGKSFQRKFSIFLNMYNVRNYVDVYLYENNIKIDNYYLVSNIPYQIFKISDNDLQLCDLFKEDKILLYIQNNDS